MRRKTELRIKKLLRDIEKQAEQYIADGHEHTNQVMTLMLEEGRYKVIGIVIVPASGDAEKDAAAFVMGQLVAPFDAYIYISEAWMLATKSREEAEQWFGRISEHPDRIECFNLHFVTKMGEELYKTWRIIRPEGERAYLQHDRDTEDPMEGRFANFYRYTFPETGDKSQ